MPHTRKGIHDVQLARTLGIPEVTLMGIGALLGGGIFTLLGHAAGLAGGALVFSMLIGSGIAFINLNAYIALATTFPQAGGGYHWVREGLGDMSGFLSGWCSWMASAVACALYAVSFGFFAYEFFFEFLNLSQGELAPSLWKTIFTVGIVFIFGAVHYRGVKLSGRLGGAIALSVLGILAVFIAFGAKEIVLNVELAEFNYAAFLPFGLAGVLQAAALFYIAFEGSEIQAQTGEEVENPARVLKIGLLASWAVVSIVYVLVALIIVGAANGNGVPSFVFLGATGERAIIETANQVMPFGYVIMLVGGLLANIGALNATIYSSSRVLFALGRDKFVFSTLGVMHPVNFVPARALIVSLVVILLVALALPITDIASAAVILFIALFMQLNISYIQLRREKPEVKWQYVVPGEPYLPMLAVLLYFLLGIALFRVSPVAIYFLAVWILLGLVNYYAYAKRVEREDQAREVVYEHSVRFYPKSEYRVILPVGTEANWERFTEIATVMTLEEGGDLLALRIHEVGRDKGIEDAFHSTLDKRVLHKIEEETSKKRLNVETRVVAAESIPEAILDTVLSENADLVLMNWDGDVHTKGFSFGRKIDTVLHRAKCDLLTVKLGTERRTRSIFIPVAVDGNPNLRFTGKVATAFHHAYNAQITVGMVIPEDVHGRGEEYFLSILEDRVRELKIKKPGGVESKLIHADYPASGIVRSVSEFDVVLLPAARNRITQAISVGSIPEQVAKNCRGKTVLIAKGHRGVAQPFWDYITDHF